MMMRKQKQTVQAHYNKAKGVTFGRPKAEKPDNWKAVMELWQSGQITAKKAMEMTGMKRTTFYKLAGI